MTTKINLLIILSLLCGGLISCGEPELPEVVEAPSEEPTPTPTPTPPPTDVDQTIPMNAALYFRLGSRWQGFAESAGFENWGGCELADTPTPVPDTPSEANCNLTIPEGQMYYSDIEFKMGTRFPELCPMISFRPYYYRRSNAALSSVDHDGDPATPDQVSGGYTPPGATTPIDCSDGETKECWGGAAPGLIEKFPDDRGYFALTAGNQQQTYVIKTENELRTYDGINVNYLITNDLDTIGRATTVTSTLNRRERVANTFIDYKVSCKNFWGETLYSLTITIADENMDGAESGTAHDNFLDWN